MLVFKSTGLMGELHCICNNTLATINFNNFRLKWWNDKNLSLTVCGHLCQKAFM